MSAPPKKNAPIVCSQQPTALQVAPRVDCADGGGQRAEQRGGAPQHEASRDGHRREPDEQDDPGEAEEQCRPGRTG